jgi:hypothetical protein
MDFEIGGIYRNREGEYEVLDIREGRLLVEYIDEQRRELSVETQRRIIQNMAKEAGRRSPSDDQAKNARFFETVGFLAANATLIEGFASAKAVKGFSPFYEHVSGRKTKNEREFYVHGDEAKWGVELRIVFPLPPEGKALEFADYAVTVRDVQGDPGLRRINSNSYVRKLFELGLVFGRSQDISQIRERIPEEYTDCL